MFNKEDININRFYLCDGGHLEFRDFEALGAISQLGIQQIWIQRPSKPLNSLYAINLQKMPPSL